MKTKALLFNFCLLGVVFLSLLTGCKKTLETTGAGDNQKSMNNLVIPDNFQWEMASTYTFLVSGKEGQIIEIKNADGAGLLHKSIIETGKTESVISLRLPTYMTEVIINDQKVTLGPAILNVSIYSLKSALSSSNKAIHLDGNDDAVKVGHHAEFTPGTGDFTCEAWVNTTDKTPDTWVRKIVSKGVDYGMYINPADGKVHGYIDNISTLGSTTSVDDGNWHHVAFKRSGTNIKIYIDGVTERSETAAGFGANLTSAADFKIGAMHEGASTNSHWHGKIDEVRCWNTARSTTEIHDNYDKKVAGTHPDLNGSWDCDENTPTPGYLKDRSTHGHDGELEHGCSPIPAPIPVLDGDGDGVPDLTDDYPADPIRAFNNYFPAVGEGTLAIEDLWPSKGDYDCNDLVLGYRFKTVTNATNKVVEVIGTFVVRAVGAHMDNGFAFQLPGAAASLLTNLNVSGYNVTGGLFSLNGTTHLEAGQSKPVVAVFSNAHDYMPGLANTIVGNPYYPPQTITITMTVPLNTYVAADFALSSWNPFLVINQERGREVHLINHPPTDLSNLSYFGTKDDASVPSGLLYYQTSNKLPWALDFPEAFDYPVEFFPINQAYLHFVEWAESGGVLKTDWYHNTAPGYRNNARIYTH
jgi:LruC domain-containing protein